MRCAEILLGLCNNAATTHILAVLDWFVPLLVYTCVAAEDFEMSLTSIFRSRVS